MRTHKGWTGSERLTGNSRHPASSCRGCRAQAHSEDCWAVICLAGQGQGIVCAAQDVHMYSLSSARAWLSGGGRVDSSEQKNCHLRQRNVQHICVSHSELELIFIIEKECVYHVIDSALTYENCRHMLEESMNAVVVHAFALAKKVSLGDIFLVSLHALLEPCYQAGQLPTELWLTTVIILYLGALKHLLLQLARKHATCWSITRLGPHH
jgi:hypothetical protein